MSDEAQASQEEAANTNDSASGGGSDEFSFYNSEHVAEDQREAYETGFKSLRDKFGAFGDWEKSKADFEERANRYDALASLEGFDEFVKDDSVTSFKQIGRAHV